MSAAPNQTLLAREFARVLRATLDAGEIATANERNRLAAAGVCHSHDFCDANMAMLEAWTTIAGTEPDLDDDQQTATWNAAWDEAMRAGFYVDEVQAQQARAAKADVRRFTGAPPTGFGEV